MIVHHNHIDMRNNWHTKSVFTPGQTEADISTVNFFRCQRRMPSQKDGYIDIRLSGLESEDELLLCMLMLLKVVVSCS